MPQLEKLIEWQVDLSSSVNEAGDTKRMMLENVKKITKQTPPELIAPIVEDEVLPLLNKYYRIAMYKPSQISPLTLMDFKLANELLDEEISPGLIKVLKRLDNVFIKSLNKGS